MFPNDRHGRGDSTNYGHRPIQQTDLNGLAAARDNRAEGPAGTDDATVVHEKARGTAYAAVTAHLADDKQLVCDCVYELISDPVDAAAAFIVLIIACGALAELWGRAIQEEPAKAWAMYAAAVARGVSHYDIQGWPED